LGKVEGSLPFSHSKNAATVSKHAGSNCGGMMGLNNDTIGSYCELTCVTFLLSSNSLIGFQGEGAVCAINLASLSLPLVILSFGIILSLITNIIGGFIIGV
jgi:Na+/H+-translocating membrane pyrophosphatase